MDELKKADEEEIIEDGIRYVPAEPYGLSKGDTMKGKVLLSSENLQNIANTMRQMAENLRTSEQEAARIAAQQAGGAARGPAGN